MMIAGMNESARCAVEEVKRETAKELLENMGAILVELCNEVRMISEAVYRGGDRKPVEEVTNEPKGMPPMVAIMQGQRDAAEGVLKELVKIREALW